MADPAQARAFKPFSVRNTPELDLADFIDGLLGPSQLMFSTDDSTEATGFYVAAGPIRGAGSNGRVWIQPLQSLEVAILIADWLDEANEPLEQDGCDFYLTSVPMEGFQALCFQPLISEQEVA